MFERRSRERPEPAFNDGVRFGLCSRGVRRERRTEESDGASKRLWVEEVCSYGWYLRSFFGLLLSWAIGEFDIHNIINIIWIAWPLPLFDFPLLHPSDWSSTGFQSLFVPRFLSRLALSASNQSIHEVPFLLLLVTGWGRFVPSSISHGWGSLICCLLLCLL